MPRFRKRPVVIEAQRYFSGQQPFPEGVCTCWEEELPHTHTLEGILLPSDGDWIIKGVRGEFYPCKDEIFRETYEPVEVD